MSEIYNKYNKCKFCEKEITWRKVLGPDGNTEKKPDGSDRVKPYERDSREHTHQKFGGVPRKLKFTVAVERSVPFARPDGKEGWVKLKLEKEYYEGERSVAQAFDEINGDLEVEMGITINKLVMQRVPAR